MVKILILSILALAIASISSAQFVNIPDTAFLHALIDEGVDTNGDSLISYSEAEAVTELYVPRWPCLLVDDSWGNGNYECWGAGNIVSLEGIEAFTNLNILDCSDNQLTSLNVTNNTALKYVHCYQNQLTSLDVSNNTALRNLDCGGNQLTSLDVSNNTDLISLKCGWNQLITLDLSNNTTIEFLIVSGMPTLYEVCVWEMPFPPEYIEDENVDTTGSPNVNFTTECTDNIPVDSKENRTIDIYPNPSDDRINIEIENINNATIEIYNVSGRLVFSKELNSRIEKIDISGLLKGIYIVKVMQNRAVNIGKVVVR
jgi:hypothetical protein